jgi:hypothetical protein
VCEINLYFFKASGVRIQVGIPPPSVERKKSWDNTKTPEVDVMITFFCNFIQFYAKMAFFTKKQCRDQMFAEFSFVLSQKCQYICHFFGENIQ